MKKMKQIILTLSLIIYGLVANAQNGLENIIVEKYYISDANDVSADSTEGILPIGSVTYRIYVDMLPGYKFQAAFGIPGHELRIETTTQFFNNEYKGNIIPNLIPFSNLKENTVMLDSWLSVGAASEGNFGILKEEDNTSETIIHENSFLQNENPEAGIPVNIRDGLIPGIAPRVTVFGIDSNMVVFNSKTCGSLFTTTNGSWACLKGACGPDSLTNKLLIAQLTTDGVLSFELNIQLGKPGGGIERYVAKNPVGTEIQLANLTYKSEAIKFASPTIKLSKEKN